MQLWKGVCISTHKVLIGACYDIPNIFGEMNSYIVENWRAIKNMDDILNPNNRVTVAHPFTNFYDVNKDMIFAADYISAYVHDLGEEIQGMVVYDGRSGTYGLFNPIPNSQMTTPFVPLSGMTSIVPVIGFNESDDNKIPLIEFTDRMIKNILGYRYYHSLSDTYHLSSETLDIVYNKLQERNLRYLALRRFLKKLLPKLLKSKRLQKFKYKNIDKYHEYDTDDVVSELFRDDAKK